MIAAVMQPYFFPYIGYYSILKNVDVYVYLDIVQYINRGWINRNRIAKPNGGWEYITVPVKKHHRETLIKDVLVYNEENWQSRILHQLEIYHKAPYYTEIMNLLVELFHKSYDTIVDLNIAVDQAIAGYLQFDINTIVLSKSPYVIKNVKAPDDWSLRVCQNIHNVNEYWNAPGGKAFYDIKKYEQAGIQIRFVKNKLRKYQQGAVGFIEGLSILDALMFNSVQDVNALIDDYCFI